MADDTQRPQPPEIIATGFAALVDGLRSDVREDIRDLRTELGNVEDRVTARVVTVDNNQKDTRAYLESFASGHGQAHETEAEDRRVAHGLFYEFIRAAELDKARRDGALGIVRYGVELLSKHAARLVGIILALAAAAGVATGNIELMVGR